MMFLARILAQGFVAAFNYLVRTRTIETHHLSTRIDFLSATLVTEGQVEDLCPMVQRSKKQYFHTDWAS